MSNPVVTFEMENGKKIVAELYPEVAPNTVNNFISLAKKGFLHSILFAERYYQTFSFYHPTQSLEISGFGGTFRTAFEKVRKF